MCSFSEDCLFPPCQIASVPRYQSLPVNWSSYHRRLLRINHSVLMNFRWIASSIRLLDFQTVT